MKTSLKIKWNTLKIFIKHFFVGYNIKGIESKKRFEMCYGCYWDLTMVFPRFKKIITLFFRLNLLFLYHNYRGRIW